MIPHSVAKRPIQLTPAGWIFIFYTIGVGAGAINTGNNLLYLIFGVFLGLILASGVLSDLSLWRLKIELVLPEEAEAGQPCYLTVRATNHKKKLASVGITLELKGRLRGQPLDLKLFIPTVLPQETTVFQIVFTPSSRGAYEIESATLNTRYPFGLLQKKWRSIAIDTNADSPKKAFLVTPALFPLYSGELERFGLEEEETEAAPLRGDGATLYGLREFRQSDNPKRIHWKASAKRFDASSDDWAHWLVKEMEKDQDSPLAILWPPQAAFEGWAEERREAFISYVASVIWSFDQKGRGAALALPKGAGYRTLGQKALWPFLSLFDFEAPAQNEVLFNSLSEDNELSYPVLSSETLLKQFDEWRKGREKPHG